MNTPNFFNLLGPQMEKRSDLISAIAKPLMSAGQKAMMRTAPTAVSHAAPAGKSLMTAAEKAMERTAGTGAATAGTGTIAENLSQATGGRLLMSPSVNVSSGLKGVHLNGATPIAGAPAQTAHLTGLQPMSTRATNLSLKRTAPRTAAAVRAQREATRARNTRLGYGIGLPAAGLAAGIPAGAMLANAPISYTPIETDAEADALSKRAATEAPETEEPENERDVIRRRRHLLLTLKRALQGGAIGGLSGGMQDMTDQDPTTNGGRAMTGLLGGGLVGAGVGAIEGGFRRAIGLDPLLETVSVARD